MIVKRVPRKNQRPTNAGVRAHARKLNRYLVNASEQDARALARYEDQSHAVGLALYSTAIQPEKVLATNAKNFRSDNFDEQLSQIDELLATVGSDKDISDHWVLSWAERDNPTVAEMFDAFAIFDKCLGIESLPSITALHGNTLNPHGHKSVLRIDLDTGQTIPRTRDGWDIDAAHRALAVIANRYPEWSVTVDRLYEVRNGRLIHCKTAADVGDPDDPTSWTPLVRADGQNTSSASKRQQAKIDSHSLQYEEDTGFKSRKRVAVEEAVPILRGVKSWLDAHAKLAETGIGLELAMNKSGANIVIDGKSVKASISDSTSLAKLKKRWGAYEPRPKTLPLAPYVPRSMFPGDVDRARYFAAKAAFLAILTGMISEVRSAEQGYRSSVPSETCDPSKLMRSSFPSYDAWLGGCSVAEPASVLTQNAPVQGFLIDVASRPELCKIVGYESRMTDKGVAYHKVGDLYNRPALFDAGRRIYVNDGEDATIRAALRIMAERCLGRPLRPFGPPAFIARVEQIAAAEGIHVEQQFNEVLTGDAAKVCNEDDFRRGGDESKAQGHSAARLSNVGSSNACARENQTPAAPKPPTSAPEQDRTLTVEADRVGVQQNPRSSESKRDTAAPDPVLDIASKVDAHREAAKAAAAALAAKLGRG